MVPAPVTAGRGRHLLADLAPERHKAQPEPRQATQARDTRNTWAQGCSTRRSTDHSATSASKLAAKITSMARVMLRS